MIPRPVLVALVMIEALIAIDEMRRAHDAETIAADALAQLEAQVRANRYMDWPSAPERTAATRKVAFAGGAR